MGVASSRAPPCRTRQAQLLLRMLRGLPLLAASPLPRAAWELLGRVAASLLRCRYAVLYAEALQLLQAPRSIPLQHGHAMAWYAAGMLLQGALAGGSRGPLLKLMAAVHHLISAHLPPCMLLKLMAAVGPHKHRIAPHAGGSCAVPRYAMPCPARCGCTRRPRGAASTRRSRRCCCAASPSPTTCLTRAARPPSGRWRSCRSAALSV